MGTYKRRIFGGTLVLFATHFSYPLFADGVLKSGAIQEFDQNGSEVSGVSHFLSFLGSSKTIQGFRLEEERAVQCFMAPCLPIKITTQYRVVSRQSSRCGSTLYTATSIKNSLPGRLTVWDHSNRRCRDYKEDEWEVTLQTAAGVRYFAGGPEQSVAELDCSKYESPMCILLYQPSRCTATVASDGTPLGTLLSETAGNACGATAKVKLSACQRGWDAEKIQIECNPLSE